MIIIIDVFTILFYALFGMVIKGFFYLFGPLVLLLLKGFGWIILISFAITIDFYTTILFGVWYWIFTKNTKYIFPFLVKIFNKKC